MKRLFPLAILALILVMIQYLPSKAQSAGANPLEPEVTQRPIYLGPVVGYNRAIHTAELASFVEDPLCPFFSNGNGNGFYAGLSFEYLLGNVTNSKSSIIGRVLYNVMPSYFEKEGDLYPSLVEKPKTDWKDPNIPEYTTVDSKTVHSIDVSFSMVTVEFMYKLNLFDTELGLTAGPTFDIPMSKNMKQIYKLVEPDYVQFKKPDDWQQKGLKYEDNDRTIIVKDGDVDGASGFRLGLKLGAQYEILMGRMYVVPAFYYNYGVTKFTSTEDWFVHALQMGVDIRFSL